MGVVDEVDYTLDGGGEGGEGEVEIDRPGVVEYVRRFSAQSFVTMRGQA